MTRIQDYSGKIILLESSTWDHIVGERRRNLTVEDIKNVLSNPDEVWQDLRYKENSQCDAYLYYQKKVSSGGKNIYLMVSVKFCPDNNYVTSAYKINRIKGQTLIYKKEDNL